MDSGSIVGIWLVMIAAGFAVAFLVHLIVKKRSVWSVLASAVTPPLIVGCYSIYALATEPSVIPPGEALSILAFLAIHSLISSVIGAIIGAWLGSGIRTLIKLARAN